jgi:hypothetical protein
VSADTSTAKASFGTNSTGYRGGTASSSSRCRTR